MAEKEIIFRTVLDNIEAVEALAELQKKAANLEKQLKRLNAEKFTIAEKGKKLGFRMQLAAISLERMCEDLGEET